MSKIFSKHEKFLLVPISKYPYFRIGPKEWQDWHRQVEITIRIARGMERNGSKFSIAMISGFKLKGKLSEIEIYRGAFSSLAPETKINAYNEANDTISQVKKALELGKKCNADVVFVSTWMQYPRVAYLSRGKRAMHYCVFGIPQPFYFFIDIMCIFLQPISDFLGITGIFQNIILRRREKGRIL